MAHLLSNRSSFITLTSPARHHARTAQSHILLPARQQQWQIISAFQSRQPSWPQRHWLSHLPSVHHRHRTLRISSSTRGQSPLRQGVFLKHLAQSPHHAAPEHRTCGTHRGRTLSHRAAQTSRSTAITTKYPSAAVRRCEHHFARRHQPGFPHAHNSIALYAMTATLISSQQS